MPFRKLSNVLTEPFWKPFDLQGAGCKIMLTYLLFGATYAFACAVQPRPMLRQGWQEAPAHGIALLISFYLIMVLSLAGIIFFGAARHLGSQVCRTFAVSAIVLSDFGVFQLYNGIRFILGGSITLIGFSNFYQKPILPFSPKTLTFPPKLMTSIGFVAEST